MALRVSASVAGAFACRVRSLPLVRHPQGAMQTFFDVAGFLWTLVIALALYSVVVRYKGKDVHVCPCPPSPPHPLTPTQTHREPLTLITDQVHGRAREAERDLGPPEALLGDAAGRARLRLGHC